MATSLKDKTVLVIGRGSGIALAITQAARAQGAQVIVAGRSPEALTEAYKGDPGVTVETVDLTDDATINALADRS